MGDWHNAPSGINRDKKRDLLQEEGVTFDKDDIVIEKDGLWFDKFQIFGNEGIVKGTSS